MRQVRNVVIPAWYNREGYINALARLIIEKCERFSDPEKPHVFFSAHGLPNAYIETLADPYKDQTCAAAHTQSSSAPPEAVTPVGASRCRSRVCLGHLRRATHTHDPGAHPCPRGLVGGSEATVAFVMNRMRQLGCDQSSRSNAEDAAPHHARAAHHARASRLSHHTSHLNARHRFSAFVPPCLGILSVGVHRPH